jgi:hypothetical protein
VLCVLLCNSIFAQAALAFLPGSSVVEHGTQRVKKGDYLLSEGVLLFDKYTI